MDRPSRGTMGRRAQHAGHGKETGDPSARRVSKRARTRTTAGKVRHASVAEPGPWSTRLRSGLLTPETSNPAEERVACPDAFARSPQKAFPFMELPAELRINIYYKALVRDVPLLLHVERVTDKTNEDVAPNTGSSTVWPTPPTILSRSRPRPRPRPVLRAPILVPEQQALCEPISTQLLRVNSVIYKEARQVLYSDNVFTLGLLSGMHTLSTLHQRSRSLIKHVTLTIPTHHDILDGFADLVRLGLRYCWGLKTFKIILQASLPDDGRVTGATSVYANAFHILRWLPRGCSVVLEGNVSNSVRRVVAEEGRLQNELDETSYLKRQHQMPEI